MAARAQTLETVVGAGVVAAAAGFLIFAFTSAREASAASGYPVTAIFERVDGISVGSDVRLSGVKVGAVSSISLDPSTYQAKVGLTIDRAVKVPSDSVAKVSSDGLLGGAYVSLEPGADTEMLKSNDKIIDTRGSIDLLTLLMNFASSQSKSGGDAPAEEPAQ
ncbi:MAG: outer membrane lipid asymmetry maintenance protein MlaD [Caulobacterales bacterium]